jgi:hypothetical protein
MKPSVIVFPPSNCDRDAAPSANADKPKISGKIFHWINA